MPSIQDVADQINAKLDQINQNTADTVTVGNGIRSDIATLDNHLQAGVFELSSGLFAIWELQKVTISILDHQTKQSDTIICLIENTNELLCGITRKLTREVALSEQILDSLERVEGIVERVEPAAAADYDRLADLHREVEECCPPEEPKPEPCPEPCAVPKPRPYRPDGQDWEPSPRPKPQG